MKKLFITLLKISISVGIIAWLVNDAANTENEAGENVFEQLANQSKDWGVLAAAWVFSASAVLLTLVRWWYLVRTLEVPLKLKEALRIGFLGYLFNLAPVGIVGGDLLKGWMLARDHRGQRAKAFASVVVDRIIGLYMLFVVATAAILLTGLWRLPDPKVQGICLVAYVLTAAGTIGVVVLITPGFTDGRVTRALAGLPRVGPGVESLIEAVRMYRRKPFVLAVSALMSVCVHSLFAIGVYLIAGGLFGFDHVLSLGTHLVVSPLSAATGVIPVAYGPFEVALEFLYMAVPEPGVTITTGQGFVVALGYRLVCVLIAMVGVCYYFGSRREVAEMMHQVDQEQPSTHAPEGKPTG